MTGRHVAGVALVALCLLTAGAAMAQPPPGPPPSGCGCGAPGPGGGLPYGGLTPGAQQHIAELGRQIAQAQRELWRVKEAGADWRTVAAKRNEVLCLRYELARYLTDLPAWSDTVLTGAEPPLPPPRPAPPRRRRYRLARHPGSS